MSDTIRKADTDGSDGLPIADLAATRRWLRAAARGHRRQLISVTTWFGVATMCGLVVPEVVGRLVAAFESGSATQATVTLAVALILVFLLAQSVLTRVARLLAARFGEAVLADLREEFVDAVLALPQTEVERGGSGDLLARSSRDISMLSNTVRSGVPSILTAVLTIVLTFVAMLIVSPLMALVSMVAVPIIAPATRWYLGRARTAYLAQSAEYGRLTAAVAETVAGAGTIESLRLAARRNRHTDERAEAVYAAERRTLRLRTVWFPIVDMGYILPLIAVLLFGGWAYSLGWVELSGVVASVLYTRMLIDPLDLLLTWLDELQTAGASLSRVIGVRQAVIPPASGEVAVPDGSGIAVSGVGYGYREGQDAVRGVNLVVADGERLALLGPSGAGKSTLGRLLAGIHAPREGTITVGGVPLGDLPLAVRRREVALVSQEHHLFTATVRENVALAVPGADDSQIVAALESVDAADWVDDLPDGLDTVLGAGGHDVPLARAQQLSLARLVLANPHTLVLDEATSLMNPHSAREVERSLAAVAKDRTVIAIVHRLHTAEDADRVILMESGNIVEMGTHEELLETDGAYRKLWRSWNTAETGEASA